MLSRLQDTAELQTSYSKLKELPLEDVLADDEDLEDSSGRETDPDFLSSRICLVIVTVCLTLFGQSLIPPTTTSSKKLINCSLAKLLEPNTRLPAVNSSLTDVVGDKVTVFFAESILSV